MMLPVIMAQEEPPIAGMRYAALGIEFAVINVTAIYVGYKLDGYLGTRPWLMMLFTIGAMVGAVQRLLWSLKKTRDDR